MLSVGFRCLIPAIFCNYTVRSLVIVSNSSLKFFHAAVMFTLVASTEPSDSPIASTRYQNVETASNVCLLMNSNFQEDVLRRFCN